METLIPKQSQSQNKIIALSRAKPEPASEISMKEFLDFLRTAYQVADSVEDTLASVEGTSEVVNWIKLKNTALVSNKSIICNDSSVSTVEDNPEAMKQKLDGILNEGLLDSVLPYLIPPVVSKSKSGSRINEKNPSSRSSSTSNSLSRRRSSEIKLTLKTDSQVEIHVCDEVKNVKKDFICSQKLLVEKMGYFAEVTSGQKLEDMDISVHCDIGIFEWLMRWVKKDITPEEEWPKLDPQCVIPILVSAAFLQMEPLLQDCLYFCHEAMNDILQSSTNLNCLNDSIITRLAAMYTNSEMEQIKDKRDKIQSRLYCKLIFSLSDPVSESVRGHWNSLAHIYRCTKCEQLIMPDIARIMPCQPTCMEINRYGDVVSTHVRDTSWNLNEYIVSLLSKLKTWRKVYWHLWGDCHFLMCTVCERPFPAHKLKWCAYHPEPPQYFTVDSGKAPLPVGRYSCCGERAYRFQLLNNFSGCQFKDHIPNLTKARDVAVFQILDQLREVIDTQPPDLIFPERLTRLVARDPATSDGKLLCKEVFWWDGIQLIPPRTNYGLLGLIGPALNTKRVHPEEEVASSKTSDDETTSSNTETSSSQSEEEVARPKKPAPKRKITRKKPVGRLWQLNLSARSNQDLQRSHEEQLLSKMIAYLSRKNSIDGHPRHKGYMRHLTPSGGTYVRLEHEWRETHCLPSIKRLLGGNRPKIRATRIV